jgi:Carboxypeptidase regulatory-like domain
MKRRILLLGLLITLACNLFGQKNPVFQSADGKVVLRGTVYDANHAIIAFSRILARSFEGKEYETKSNDEGHYKFELPPALYKMEASAPGFCPKRIELFRVRSYSTPFQPPLDFILDVPPNETPGTMGYRPCKQKTMIEKEPPKGRSEPLRSIAE